MGAFIGFVITTAALLGAGGSAAKAKYGLFLTAVVGVPLGVLTLLFVNRTAGPDRAGAVMAWAGSVLLGATTIMPVVGAVRLAKPESWWARTLYRERKSELARARFYKSPSRHLRPNPTHPGDAT